MSTYELHADPLPFLHVSQVRWMRRGEPRRRANRKSSTPEKARLERNQDSLRNRGISLIQNCPIPGGKSCTRDVNANYSALPPLHEQRLVFGWRTRAKHG